MKAAKNLSLTSKNARAITVRAGHQASGFKAITDFIEELAKITIKQATLINQEAINLSKLSVDQARTEQALTMISSARERSEGSTFIHTTLGALTSAEEHLGKITQQFDQTIMELKAAIEETRKQMASATVIVTSSRVEACQAGPFEDPLTVIADNIETITQQIKQHLNIANSLLANNHL